VKRSIEEMSNRERSHEIMSNTKRPNSREKKIGRKLEKAKMDLKGDGEFALMKCYVILQRM